MNNIILIGFMGTGKTTVGRRIAARLGLDFYDTDEYVKKCEKMSVYDIIQKKGKKYFEGAERFAVVNLAEKEKSVISTGGTTFWNEENRKILKKSGVVVWLCAEAETITENTKNSHNKRQQINGLNADEIKTLVDESNVFYESCDFKINVDNIEIDEICDKIVYYLNTNKLI